MVGGRRRRRQVATFGPVRTQRRAVLGAIAATALLFTAAACDSDADDSAATTPAATEQSADTTDAPADGPASTEAPDTPTTAPAGDTGGTEPPAPTEAPVVVPDALQFTAPLVGGGTFDGAAVAGKPTAFWFWAPT